MNSYTDVDVFRRASDEFPRFVISREEPAPGGSIVNSVDSHSMHSTFVNDNEGPSGPTDNSFGHPGSASSLEKFRKFIRKHSTKIGLVASIAAGASFMTSALIYGPKHNRTFEDFEGQANGDLVEYALGDHDLDK